VVRITASKVTQESPEVLGVLFNLISFATNYFMNLEQLKDLRARLAALRGYL
jgi:hypothetical protein